MSGVVFGKKAEPRPSRESSITACLFAGRDGETKPIFQEERDGTFSIVMDGYAVVPLEDYEKHRKSAKQALRALSKVSGK